MLYASSQRLGCFLETLARFRVDLELLAQLSQIEGEDDFAAPGTIPVEWFPERVMGSAWLQGSFAEVCNGAWIGRLRPLMATECLRYGMPDFDESVILGPNRTLTQRISRLIYEDPARFDGIRYPSRHGQDIENWALFEPFRQITAQQSVPISRFDPDLLVAMELFNLRLG